LFENRINQAHDAFARLGFDLHTAKDKAYVSSASFCNLKTKLAA
jgi:hypothetical protein